MARVKNGAVTKARHKKVLKAAKGYFGSKHRLYKTAKKVKKRKNDYVIGKPGIRHNTGSKSASFNIECRKGSNLSKADQNRLKNII